MTIDPYILVKNRLAAVTGEAVHEAPIAGRVFTEPDYYVASATTRARRRRSVQRSIEHRVTVRVKCVSRTLLGVDRMAAGCRRALLDWAPVAGRCDPLIEIDTSPVITDTAGGDTRHSVTLTYRTTAPLGDRA